MPDGLQPGAGGGYPGRLAEGLTSFSENAVMAAIREALAAGEDPRRLVEALNDGTAAVGKLFEDGSCYISGLLYAGEIIRCATEALLPALEASGAAAKGLVILGTPAGDLHDLGKNLAACLLRAEGFRVADLGTGVTSRIFLKEILQREPDVVGLSVLVPSSVEEVKRLVKLLRDAYTDRPAPPVFVGFGFLGPEFPVGRKAERREAAKKFLEVDHVVLDAWEAVSLCRSLMEGAGDPFAREEDRESAAEEPG
ncbi:MAG: cobalamin-dependent protein [Deltaproteobacteria bacterium]|jgi:5-methyltetrahydrofolate--homocysteine methyltransferase|nr:cobalamin-dependent protein [Deltaproteobacteria bacterium]